MSATPNVRSVFTHNGNQVVFGENLNIEANALREPFEFNQNGPVGSLISQLVVHRDQSNAEMTKLLDKLRSEGALPKQPKVKEEDEEAEEYESDESADEE
jgi:hypothetical protein